MINTLRPKNGAASDGPPEVLASEASLITQLLFNPARKWNIKINQGVEQNRLVLLVTQKNKVMTK